MADWRQTLQQWSERVEALSLRERVLVLLCVMAVMTGGWQWLFEIPQERMRESLVQQRSAIASDIEAQQAQLQALLSAGEHHSASEELVRLEAQIKQLDESLASLSQGLVSADQLPTILQQVLVSTTELELRRMRTLPVEALQLTAQAEPTEAGAREAGVFRHSVELELSGRYFEVVAFLERLETMPWRFYWDRLDYEVADYPRGEVRLRVYTLSAEEGLLGV